MNQLSVGDIVSNSIKLATQNFVPILLTAFLWAITAWIPYLNVGTTIGLYSMVLTIARGGTITPMEIFDAKYRRNMGEFFLLVAFISMGIYAGYAFVVVPGIVIAIAWGQAVYLWLDKGLTPLDAIRRSNELTYGNKANIFFGTLVLSLGFYIVFGLLALLARGISPILFVLVVMIGLVAAAPILLSAAAYIYGELTKSARRDEDLGLDTI